MDNGVVKGRIERGREEMAGGGGEKGREGWKEEVGGGREEGEKGREG